MINSIRYTINKAECNDIEKHLKKCSDSFIPPLSSYVDIHSYAAKIEKFADTFEAWYEDELVSLTACYLNNLEDKKGFITNISTVKHFQGNGVARKLLDNLFNYATRKNFNKLSLEVHKDNLKIIDFYIKVGFHKVYFTKDDKFIVMSKYLNNEYPSRVSR